MTASPAAPREESRDDEPTTSQGLFDGFEAYRTPTSDDYRSVLTTGLVVPDTNVLLNLYRYNEGARADFFNVLENLGDRLWVPHQVLVEFWRNRESVLEEPERMVAEAIASLRDLLEQATKAARQWANRVALQPERREALEAALARGFSETIQGIQGAVQPVTGDRALDTQGDEILKRLESVLQDRVGAPLGQEKRAEAIEEGSRRIQKREPPGYLDADKNKRPGDEGGAGDYFVWEQVLAEAERQRCDVLLVTGDVKDDWWRRERGQARGPRVELAQEFRRRTGKRLYMLRPESLLLHARDVLQLDVDEGTLRNIEQIDRSIDDLESGGWTAETIRELMERLAAEAPDLYKAMIAAAEGGGFVTRDRVYEIGGYDEGRTLRAFTKPSKRIAEELKQDGKVSTNAADVLEAVYDASSKNPSQASGFQIPSPVVPLIKDYLTALSLASSKLSDSES